MNGALLATYLTRTLFDRRFIFAAAHVLAITAGIVVSNSMAGSDFFVLIFALVPVGLVLHSVAYLRNWELQGRWRSIARALAATGACTGAWLLVFFLGALLCANGDVLLVGLVASLPFGLITSGLGLLLRVRPFY